MSFDATIFIAIAIICNTINKILDRYVLKNTSPYAFSWLTQTISAIVFLPFAWTNMTFPETKGLIAVIIAGIAWTLTSFSSSVSKKNAEISVKEPIAQSKVIWALLLGILILGENVTLTRVIGTIIIFAGVSILLFHPERKFGRITDPDVTSTLITAVLYATVTIIDKYTLTYFKPEVYAFFVYLIPCIIFTSFLPKKISEVKELLKSRGRTAVVSILIATITYYSMLKAYTLADVTLVYPLLQLAMIFAVLIGILFMGEKEHKWQKIVASMIVLIGAIIVKS